MQNVAVMGGCSVLYQAPAVISSGPPTPGIGTDAYVDTLYLEGQGDLVSRLTLPITHIVTPSMPIINLVTKSP